MGYLEEMRKDGDGESGLVCAGLVCGGCWLSG